MHKFSFKEKKDLIFLEGASFRPPLDKNGNVMSGDDFLRALGTIAETWEKKNKMPVPISEQKFVAWTKQAKKMLADGISSDEIFSRTIVQ